MHSHRRMITWAVAASGQELHVEGGNSNHWLPWSGLSASTDVQPVVHTPLSVVYFPSLCTPSSHHTQSACTWTQFPLWTRMHMCAHTRAHALRPPLTCTPVPTQALTHRTHATHRQACSCRLNGCWELGSASSCWPPLPASVCQAVSMATHLGSDGN